jgi:AhpD family alkylhydroperoxidase
MKGPSPERTKQANEYVQKKMKLLPRMFQATNTIDPRVAEKFVDFYEVVFGDGVLSQKTKELMILSIAVAYQSPACLAHTASCVDLGATDGEIYEAVQVGAIYVGFVPGGVGIPYAFSYAAKCLEIAAKHRAGENWEYLTPAEFKMDR